MGSTTWAYWTPYRESPAEALRELRDRVFREGNYGKKFPFHNGDLSYVDEYLERMLRSHSEEDIQRMFGGIDKATMADLLGRYKETEIRKQQPGEDGPSYPDIQSLMEAVGPEGTHSILDLQGIADVPTPGFVSPMTDEAMVEVFGTTTPSTKLVDSCMEHPYFDAIQRWQGVYVHGYIGRKPTKTFFTGNSGD